MRVPHGLGLPPSCTVPQTCSTQGQNWKVQDVRRPPHTEVRGKQWWYRRRVPADLIPIIGFAEYRESLRTPDIEIARTRAALKDAAVALEFEQALAQLRQQTAAKPVLPEELPNDIRTYVRDAVFARVLAEDEDTRMARPDDEALDVYESMRVDEFEATGDGLRTGRIAWGRRRKQEMVGLLHAIGVSVTPDSPSWDVAAYKATEGWNAAVLAIGDRMKGTAVATPEPPTLPAMLRPAPIEPDPAPASSLTLGAVIDDYMASVRENDFKRKVRRCLQLLGEMVGRDLPVAEFRQKVVTQFLRDICKLPDKWALRFDKGESVQKMLTGEAPRVMSPTTYEGNYRGPLGTFLTAARRDHGDEGFPSLTVEGIKYTGDRIAEEDQQRALKEDELRTLFEGEEFAQLARDPGGESLYWFLVVMLFTGARPREVCQTNPQVDFGQVDGVWYMDLDERSTPGVGVKKTVKTGEARRIPLHPELVRLQFPSYVERVKQVGADRLFPDWRVKQGNPFTAHYERVSRLLKAVGLYNRAAPPGALVTGAYCLRKTFITECRNQGVVSKEITGHRDEKTTAIQDRHYVFGPEPLARKARELQKLAMAVRIPVRRAEG